MILTSIDVKSKDEFKGLILSKHAKMCTWALTYRREHISQQFQEINQLNPFKYEPNVDMPMSNSRLES